MAVKNVKRRIQYGRIIDLLLSILLIIISMLTIIKLSSLSVLPGKYLLAIIGILTVLNLILFLSTFLSLHKALAYCKRGIMVLLCIGLWFAGNVFGNAKNALTNVTTPQNTTVKMSVIVKTELASGQSYSNLNNLDSVGVQSGPDTDNAVFMKEQLMKEDNQLEYVEYPDYTSMANDLLLEHIDAMAISDSYLTMLDTNMEEFKGKYKVIKTYSRELQASETASKKDISKEPFTVYVSGMDEIGSPDQNLRSDVNILLIVNPLTNHIQMISFPRDSYIPNTGTNDLNDKLTHTGIYGIDTTISSMENFLGIEIDYYAKVSFSSLIEIVDIIGGIDVDVEISFCEQDEFRNMDAEHSICLESGVQQLNGKQALAYSRHRKTEGYDNPGRERAQQRVIKGIISKMLSPSGVAKINALMEAVPNYVLTNMPSAQITSFVSNELDDLKPWTISSTTIGSDGINDIQVTASLGEDYPQDVYLLNKFEVLRVLYAYDKFSKPLDFSNLTFDMDDLYQTDLSVNKDPNIVWDYLAQNPH